jgi:hypothetical protein
MGIPQADTPDIGQGRVNHSFATTGASPSIATPGPGAVNVTIGGSGWTGSVRLRRSFDAGTTWHVVFTPDGATARIHTAPISYWTWEQEAGVLYQLDCTALSSGGPIPARLSF